MELTFNVKPNSGHMALAELERLNVVKFVITQSVDGLHQVAGTRNVVELHGSIRKVRCTKCDFKRELDGPRMKYRQSAPKCDSLLRPDVVWLGEPLPEDAWKLAVELCNRAGAILVVGTSCVVMPAGYLPYMVKRRGGIVIEVNVEPSAITPMADVFLQGKAAEVLSEIVR